MTPVMGMIKDVYDYNLPADEQNVEPHAIDTIYVLWVMPTIVDYETFREELEAIVEKAKEPGRPKLVLSVYVTRSKDSLKAPFIAGRPNIGSIFNTMTTNHPGKSGLVFACGPTPLVSELWDKSIQCTLKGIRIDFHHEVFDF